MSLFSITCGCTSFSGCRSLCYILRVSCHCRRPCRCQILKYLCFRGFLFRAYPRRSYMLIKIGAKGVIGGFWFGEVMRVVDWPFDLK